MQHQAQPSLNQNSLIYLHGKCTIMDGVTHESVNNVVCPE